MGMNYMCNAYSLTQLYEAFDLLEVHESTNHLGYNTALSDVGAIMGQALAFLWWAVKDRDVLLVTPHGRVHIKVLRNANPNQEKVAELRYIPHENPKSTVYVCLKRVSQLSYLKTLIKTSMHKQVPFDKIWLGFTEESLGGAS